MKFINHFRTIKALRSSIISALLALVISTPIFSQEQTGTQQKNKKPPEELTYSLIEIPSKIEEVGIYFQKLAELVKPSPFIIQIDSLYKIYLQVKKDLENEADLDKPENYYTRKLDDLKQRWEQLDNQVNEWQKVVGERVTELETEKKKVDEYIIIWEKTYDNANNEMAPPELLFSVQEVQTELRKFQLEIATLITKNLKIQNKFADENIQLGVNVSKLKNVLRNRREEILSQDSAPLWEAIFESEDTISITKQLEEIWNLYTRSADDFIEVNRKNNAVHIILLLIAIIFVYGLKFFSKKLDKNDESINLALKILDRPVSIIILLFLIFIATIYPDIPEVLKSLTAIIVLIPLLRILFHISNRSLHLPLMGLTILFVINEIQNLTFTESLLERLLLLLITLLAIAGLSWLIWEKTLQQVFAGRKGSNFINLGTRVAAILLVASLVLNTLGYVKLAEILFNGTIFSTFAIILIVTSYLIVQALLIIFLQTKTAKRLRVVQKHPTKIKNTTLKIIRLVAAGWLTIAILNNFQLRELVQEWLISALTKKWIIGTFSLSIGDVLLFFVTIWIAVLVARLVRFFLEEDILSRMTLPRGVPGAVSAIVKYIIIGFGTAVAFTAAGLELDKFTLLVGALGVGIGFGLQDLVNNFISGLILIFERPIQVHDAVQVDTLSGRVRQIGIRSSIIKTWQGAEVIVPNGQLISNKLINWTMSDHLRRIEIIVGAKYGSDVELIMKVLLQCAKNHEQILVSPAPSVLFNDFADSCLEFELRCWTSNYNSWLDIRSEIRVAIDSAFKDNNIEIPFPQRDLHIVSDLTKDKESQRAHSVKDTKSSGR